MLICHIQISQQTHCYDSLPGVSRDELRASILKSWHRFCLPFRLCSSFCSTHPPSSASFPLGPRFAIFSMLGPFNAVPQAVVTANYKIISLLLHNCNSAIVMDHNANTRHGGYPLHNSQRAPDPQVENRFSRQMAYYWVHLNAVTWNLADPDFSTMHTITIFSLLETSQCFQKHLLYHPFI